MPASHICLIAATAIILCHTSCVVLAFNPSLKSRTTSIARPIISQYSAIGCTSASSSVLTLPSFKYYSKSSTLSMSEQNESQSSLPLFLDPGTKGGALVLSAILFVVPIVIYQVATGIFGADEIEVGRNIGVGFSVITMLLWGGTYIFRVATKDMTYAKQLKDYEDAVIAKRLEELDEDEVQALVEDIEREQF